MKMKNAIKWTLRVLLYIFIIGFILFSFILKIENDRLKVICDMRAQQYFKLHHSLDSERVAYQDTIKILRLKIK